MKRFLIDAIDKPPDLARAIAEAAEKEITTVTRERNDALKQNIVDAGRLGNHQGTQAEVVEVLKIGRDCLASEGYDHHVERADALLTKLQPQGTQGDS